MRYELNIGTKTCNSSSLTEKFDPIHIPANATLAGQFTIGINDGKSGDGLAVEEWVGNVTRSGLQAIHTAG